MTLSYKFEVTLEGNYLEVKLGALSCNLACRLTLVYTVIFATFESVANIEIPGNFIL